MLEILHYLLPIVVKYKYWAIFAALTVAGLGIPIPEEATIIVAGFLTAIDILSFWPAFLICYAGVLCGDLFTYSIGRFGGRSFLRSQYSRLIISRKRLAQVQYYYRLYGEISVMGARQIPGLRFASFFTAGMLKMKFWKFLLLDGIAGLFSMPLIFLITYYFGAQLKDAVQLILRIRDISFFIAIGIIISLMAIAVIYKYLKQESLTLDHIPENLEDEIPGIERENES